MQELKEAVGVECKTTIFNPNYIKEKMKGEAGSAATFAEIIQNTYGWNVMKPAVIDNEMWDEIYDAYVTDKFRLNIIDYFERQNPAALEEMTAVMLETARKGMWKATDEQISNTAKLHVELVNKFNPSCSGFVCDNAKLREFIKQNASPQDAADYASKIDNIRQSVTKPGDKGMIMRKEELSPSTDAEKNAVDGNLVVFIVAASAIAILLLVWKRRKGNK